MDHYDAKHYFSERIRKTDLHGLGIGTHQISESLLGIIGSYAHDYYQRRDARLIGEILIEFADRPEDVREEVA